MSETERVRAVIVSVEALAAFGKQDLVEAILGAGAEVWLLVGDEPFDPQTHPSLAAVRTRFPGGSFKVSAIRGADAGMLTPGVWARDYAPLFARTSEGRIRLLDLNYDTPGLPGDSAPAGIEKSFGARRVSLPISLEGGNFMIDEKGLCVSTERVVRNNAEGATPGAPVNGYTREALVDFYKDYFGCRDVMLVPTMPFEQTGHVDLYAKFLGQGRVAVADLYANEFEAAYPGDIYMRNVLFKPVKEEFLDARAKEFADRGYEVVRIPIGIPQYDQPKRKYRNRSYLNALFVNGTAIVPRYESWEVNGLGYKDARFHHDAGKEGVFLAEARKRYEEAGFKVVTVEASALAHQNGAVHCVTMQVPEGAFEPAPAPAPPRGPEPAP